MDRRFRSRIYSHHSGHVIAVQMAKRVNKRPRMREREREKRREEACVLPKLYGAILFTEFMADSSSFMRTLICCRNRSHITIDNLWASKLSNYHAKFISHRISQLERHGETVHVATWIIIVRNVIVLSHVAHHIAWQDKRDNYIVVSCWHLDECIEMCRWILCGFVHSVCDVKWRNNGEHSRQTPQCLAWITHQICNNCKHSAH